MVWCDVFNRVTTIYDMSLGMIFDWVSRTQERAAGTGASAPTRDPLV